MQGSLYSQSTLGVANTISRQKRGIKIKVAFHPGFPNEVNCRSLARTVHFWLRQVLAKSLGLSLFREAFVFRVTWYEPLSSSGYVIEML